MLLVFNGGQFLLEAEEAGGYRRAPKTLRKKTNDSSQFRFQGRAPFKCKIRIQISVWTG